MVSLGKTLLKVAIGVAVVKGMSSLAKGGFGGAAAEKPLTKRKTGGLEDMMGQILGGGRSRTAAPDSGSGDLLDQITGAGSRGGAVPKVERAAGKGQTAGRGAGRIGAALEPMTRTPRRNAPSGGLEDLLGGAVAGGALAPKAREAELEAALAFRAMIQAVKADGTLDDGEKQKLMGQLGEATRDEVAFVQAELQRPVDVDGLARKVPNGMEEQVYLASLMAINLDNQQEAQYLAALAEALELRPAEVNALHDRVGAPHVFR